MMSPRRSLRVPITLAVVMICLLVILTVALVLVSISAALTQAHLAGLYWSILSVGSVLMLLLVLGVVWYLTLSIKAINLNRRQSNFIDSVTHELKSPIASMKLYLQTLSRHQVDTEKQLSFYRYMLEDVERLDHLINQLLDAGRLDSDRIDGKVEDVSMASLLQESAQNVCLRYRVPETVVQLELEPCVVRARRVHLDLVFSNLLDNAVKYADADPKVEVTMTQADEHWCVICVRDNGQGIPQKLRHKIFGRFVRLGLELEREKLGTGLGLYIVHTLVRRLGGKVRVRDPENGSGTVFEVRLPGIPADEASDKADSSQETVSHEANNPVLSEEPSDGSAE